MEETDIFTSTQDTHGDLAPASTSRIMPVAPSPTAPATTTSIDLAATTPSDVATTRPIDLAGTTPSDISITTPSDPAAMTPIDLATTTHSNPHAMSSNDPVAPSLSSTAPSPLIIPGPPRSTVTPNRSEPYQRGCKTQNTEHSCAEHRLCVSRMFGKPGSRTST